jgi:hypothetical protein
MSAPIYKGGRPFVKPGVRLGSNTGVFPVVGAPVDGTTLANVAGPGSILLSTSGVVYVNTGSKSSPTWTVFSAQQPSTTTKALVASETAYSANVVPTDITGFSWTVAASGVYVFDLFLDTTMTTVGGLTLEFKLTTATLTSIRYDTYASTASDNTLAVSTTGTTTTDSTKVFDSKTSAYTYVKVSGSFVVNAGGSFKWQACQNTSAGAGDATQILIGSRASLVRVA